ncbi:MAG TPA: cytochrome c oxidase subunit I [Gemmatimonadaceae bacterium]|nr:cytochrome c oxidase subunit I [Gemmatimonadaceae bacterium]
MAAPVIRPVTEAPVEELKRIWETPPNLYGHLASVDHKTIGKRYLVTALAFLVIGGVEALAMRIQLASPGQHVLTPEAYDQLFTMHGLTMILWYASPILSGFSNYIWPLLIGARDMAYPRVNALSYWTYLASGIFLYTSPFLGQAPNDGWFGYAPYSLHLYNGALNMDFYALGLIFLTISTTVGAINFIGTIMSMRAPGMSLNRMPVFMYGTMTASFSIIFALPALSAACVFLYLERRFGFHFYDATAGGSPLLWQHLFWIFGHPWVYVVVLPAMGMISDIIPVFSRRPIVGYTAVAISSIATGIIGFGVWVHHMFATGLPMLAASFYSGASNIIAIPSAIAVFAWIATVWLGRPVFKTPMLFSLGFIVLFVIGGVSGVVTAAVPYDWQVTDSYFVVAHLHYVLVGINVFGVMAGFYYWGPKITGRLLDERLGQWNFWTMFVGMNLAFFPMHIAGILGMPRRIYVYPASAGWDTVNMLTSIGAFLFAAGLLIFIVNWFVSLRRGIKAGPNPWNGATLEWAVDSPPPPYNFAVIPTVRSRDPLWERAYLPASERSIVFEGPVLDRGRDTLATTPLSAEDPVVQRMPEDTLYPFCVAAEMLAIFYGLVFGVAWLAIVGVILLVVSFAGWLWPSTPEEDKGSLRPGRLAMTWMIATEAALFAYLLFSNYYVASQSRAAWPPSGPLPLSLVVPNTILLILSSFAYIWGERGLKLGSMSRFKTGTRLAFLLGLAFIIIQGIEWHGLPFTPQSHAFGSFFYTVTGFHGAHVILGLLMILAVLVWTSFQKFTPERHRAVTLAGMYWHFVDIVWLFVFASFYLAPRWIT